MRPTRSVQKERVQGPSPTTGVVQSGSYRLVMRRIGIVGHRALDREAAAFVSAESAALLRAECSSRGDVVAISALAEGADTLFAEAALRIGVPLEIVRPFDRYVDDFVTTTSRSRYRGLAEAARRETRFPSPLPLCTPIRRP